MCNKKLLKIIQQLFIQYYHFVTYFTICAEIKTKCHYNRDIDLAIMIVCKYENIWMGLTFIPQAV